MIMKPFWKTLVVSFLLLSLLSWLFYKESRLVSSLPVNSWTEDSSADCAVVLTGASGRVREGVDALYQKRVKKLIISGVYQGAQWKEIFPQWIYYGELEPNDIVLERRSATTFGNAQQTLPLVEALGCRDILLITSRLHMYRSFRIFDKYYPDTINIIPVAVVSGSYKPKVDDVLIESFKSLFYSLWAY
ncbi:MAG: YdcF family protein [Bdellovibrionaceae bacterium]|nr:YdcF family protein [Pseudobdellovibrionaceae bacterium]MCB9092890.1 YdcF family protein [Halobacteriovoraceae bacterium]